MAARLADTKDLPRWGWPEIHQHIVLCLHLAKWQAVRNGCAATQLPGQPGLSAAQQVESLA